MESLQVLIVEDESLVSQGLVLMVTQIGHTVVGTASDGESAVEEVIAKDPDVVLIDVQGPELDGIETTRRIMEEHGVPVVVLSSLPDQEYAVRAAEAGAFGYLQKPISPSDLIPALAVAIERFRDWVETHEELNQLKDTLETRKAAEQAKGIIM
ncbi:MAG: response regulator, partial [Armatimonadota bacterium]